MERDLKWHAVPDRFIYLEVKCMYGSLAAAEAIIWAWAYNQYALAMSGSLSLVCLHEIVRPSKLRYHARTRLFLHHVSERH